MNPAKKSKGDIRGRYRKLAEEAAGRERLANGEEMIRIQVGSATCEHAAGSLEVADEFEKHIAATGRRDIRIHRTGCTGRCSREPIIGVLIPGRPPVKYERVNRELVHRIFVDHIQGGEPLADHILDRKSLIGEGRPAGAAAAELDDDASFLSLYGDVPFFKSQTRVVMRHNGVIDPDSIDQYLAASGFEALAAVLERGDPDWVIDQLAAARLRGRGGGGYLTADKWRMMRNQRNGRRRFVICNGDEGDPGAFMDRSMLESDPFNVIEGMIIGAYAAGAAEGFVYIRAEYPLAIRRIENAIARCREHGLLGRSILGADGFDFDIEIRLGAGAFVCGEETALIRSIEGERGQPRIRPPYPTDSGLEGLPTLINNVETFANVTAIINRGGEWFAGLGTDYSGGTKVFALAGKVRHTGLVEVPLGTPLRRVVEEIGGGVPGGRAIKAVQTGGPAGGFIPASLLDLTVDFDTLGRVGSIMGSGGMIVLSEEDCMVDIAKFYLSFSREESCGKCSPCREGTMRMLEILERITAGGGEPEDLDRLERLARLVSRTSLCGLGRAAPNPVLSGLNHFGEEYLAHVAEGRCPAKKCAALVRYEIDEEKCIGCTLCARRCPAACIRGERKGPHRIEQEACVRCGVCFEVCRFDAVRRN